MPVGSIYFIYCKITEMYYIGQTVRTLECRIAQHKIGDLFVDREIRRLGWENFNYGVLEDNVPVKLLNERERHYIKIYDCIYPNGYNKTPGGYNSSISRGNFFLVSTRGRYALRVMLDLAMQDAEKFIPLEEIATRQGISKNIWK